MNQAECVANENLLECSCFPFWLEVGSARSSLPVTFILFQETRNGEYDFVNSEQCLLYKLSPFELISRIRKFSLNGT